MKVAKCPNCGAEIELLEKLGETIVCPSCELKLQVKVVPSSPFPVGN